MILQEIWMVASLGNIIRTTQTNKFADAFYQHIIVLLLLLFIIVLLLFSINGFWKSIFFQSPSVNLISNVTLFCLWILANGPSNQPTKQTNWSSAKKRGTQPFLPSVLSYRQSGHGRRQSSCEGSNESVSSDCSCQCNVLWVHQTP